MDKRDEFPATSTTTRGLAQDDASSDPELTAHEYARECGLCIDYLTESPLNAFQNLCKYETPSADLVDPEGTAQLESTADDLARERLDVDLKARELLYWIMKDEKDMFLHTLPTIKSFPLVPKVEPPLLDTDHELDVLRFGHRTSPDFTNMNLPMEHTECEMDESLEWSTKYLNLPIQLERRYSAEKLELPRKGFEFLMDVMNDSWDAKEREQLYANIFAYTKVRIDVRHRERGALINNLNQSRAIELVTPPLLPFSPPFPTFELNADDAELELLSESTNAGAAEAVAVNRKLSRQDRILPLNTTTSDEISLSNTEDLQNLYSPLLSILESSASSPPKRRGVNDLKVEVPLTPQKHNSSSPTKKVKRVTFPEMLHEYVPDLPINVDVPQLVRDSDESVNAFFDEVIEPIALEATRALEQEQLQEADSLYRVSVPIMDFTGPVPPWKIYGRKGDGKYVLGATDLDLQQHLLQEMKRDNLKHFPIWSGGSKIERQLPWSPFPPELGKIELDESIANDGRAYLQHILDFMSLEDVVISDSLTWKPDGLRILDDVDDSEEELEGMDIEELESKGMNSLPGKRKRELEDGHTVREHPPATKPSHVLVRGHDDPPRQTEKPASEQIKNQAIASSTQLKATVSGIGKPHAQDLDPPERQLHTDMSDSRVTTVTVTEPSRLNNLGLFGTTFSAAAALSNFMKSMGKSVKQPEALAPAATLPQKPSAPRHPAPLNTESFQTPSLIADQPVPYPHMPTDVPPAFFILSTNLLQSQRILVRSISRLCPSANCVDRDFTTIPEASEADILLSPATGLILTTLQKIKQRALPGQKMPLTGIRERLVNLSGRYERLIVLAGEGAAKGNVGREMDERDCEALSEFVGFAAGLAADVQVLFVPGGEEDLVKWVVGCLVRYSLTSVRGERVVLLQDETLVSSCPFTYKRLVPMNFGQWEQLLRRIGLNAFAAQLVLAELKDTTDANFSTQNISSSEIITSSAPSDEFGIRAFVCMDPQERVQRFETLLGGRRVLNRINKVLEQKWQGAVNVFRSPTQLQRETSS
jgi:hypothetical protein